MPRLGVDLNIETPESDQIYPVHWDDIEGFNGPAHEFDYDMIWDNGIQGALFLSFCFVLPCLSSVYEI
ncbi:hypothetical protein HU200_060091 [Digitaria exilis]|uniref:Uncharacterized protein n=1 Tax=Digitaria exilis TaxID=1010633 RepID=A0A835AD91_9POAL|nr:hypothetical protein HU200_060091 [Digitaria exilis]